MNILKSLFLLACLFGLLAAGLNPASGQAQAPASEIGLYGFVLLNANYNTGAPQPVDIPVYARGGTEGSYLMTARQSRFGVQFRHNGDLPISGVLEADLWGLLGSGAAGAATQAAPRLRLAFFTMGVSETSSLSFGQNWAVFAPLNPNSLTHLAVPALAGSGNLWARLPQIRYSYNAAPVLFDLAILRPLSGETAPAVSQNDALSAGEYSRLPFLQARAAYGSPGATIGLSGHLGRLDRRNDALEEDQTTTYGLAADLLLNLGAVSISGELFTAQNNRMFSGLVESYIADNRLEDRESFGGWAQLSYTSGPMNLNAGFGIEDTDDDRYNRTFFANGIYTVPETPVSFALELDVINTKDPAPEQDNVTIGFAARYAFSRWW